MPNIADHESFRRPAAVVGICLLLLLAARAMAHWPERKPAVLENAIEIERRSSLHPDETMARYLAGEGRPVVITDAQESWKARKLWSLEYFKKHYASEQLIASDRAPLRSEDNPRMNTLRTTLGEFIDYMQQPNHFIAAQERDGPFYGNSWSPFIEHEKLRGHISRPYFVPDDIPRGEESPEHARLDRSFTKIFLGPSGTVTRIHNDTYHTHAWLSQIRGSKQFILYPPSQAHLIHVGEGVAASQIDSPKCRTANGQTWLDPLAPDYAQFPRARKATPYVATCGPGETILVPSDWFHYAVALEPSITLMRNFMNAANQEPFMDVWTASQQNGGQQKKPPPPPSPTRIPPPVLPPLKDPTARAPLLGGPGAPMSRATLNSQPPLPLPTPQGGGGKSAAMPPPSATPASAGAAGGATAIDGGRTVQRFGDGVRPPLWLNHEGSDALAGTSRLAVDPLDGLCGRRAATAWRWCAPRRG